MTSAALIPKHAVRSLVLLAALFAAPARADTVWLRDGTSVEGRVVRYEKESLILDLGSGKQRTILRDALARIEFAQGESPALPKVEIKVLDADDSLTIEVNGQVVTRDAIHSDWLPIQDRLIDGNNRLTAHVTNRRGGWAYSWELRISGRITHFHCGEPRRQAGGCQGQGRRGTETGTVDLPTVWLHCDTKAGSCEPETSEGE